MSPETPQSIARSVVMLCANCDQCRELLDDAPCQFFPRLYMLADRSRAHGTEPGDRELAELIDMCNACGQCPCASVQLKIREAKDAFVARDGLPLGVRLVEDVRLVGRLCGTLPSVTNALMAVKPLAGLLKRLLGIHPDRQLPVFPPENFDAWAERRGLTEKRPATGRKVAYFVGCTARHMFPEVAKATVEVLEANGITVWMPPQTCCGMPTYLEGDRDFTHRLAETNLPVLEAAIADGWDVVTACPTCSYAFKSVLAHNARFSAERRAAVTEMLAEEGGDVARVKARLEAEALAPTGRVSSAAAGFHATWILNQIAMRPYAGEGLDDGYFADLDAKRRIAVASHTWELGEFLRDLARTGELRPVEAISTEKLAYFPPCHLREQGIGHPWSELLAAVPATRVETVGRSDDCCGLGGVMGYKTTFHFASLAMGRGLMARTEAAAPDRVVTECLGCRVQFQQMTAHPVSHPVELLAAAYRAADAAPGTPPPTDGEGGRPTP
ncbi:FeS-binding protein [Siculibacillus lacustris]|uniref:FeS-binding protein n=1 Tax=Siculibacillus lacustris TaxID=1549641 RepID=A0A4Q9VRB3_9HYPH|nr:heterodisulfide reductase-related iron-sulfur binding cluster [Siculibacillus lacustris]TBW38431.1 FeS-binding protein [Siculibacillus lacustris]